MIMQKRMEGTFEELLAQANTGDVIMLNFDEFDIRSCHACPTGVIVRDYEGFLSLVTFTGIATRLGKFISNDWKCGSAGIVFRNGNEFSLMKYSGEIDDIGKFENVHFDNWELQNGDWTLNNEGILISSSTDSDTEVITILTYNKEQRFYMGLGGCIFIDTTPDGIIVKANDGNIEILTLGSSNRNIGSIDGNLRPSSYGIVVEEDLGDFFTLIRYDGTRTPIGSFRSDTWELCPLGIVMTYNGEFSLVVVK